MKLSKETVAYLKNLATINGNLLIKPGNTLSTISAAKSVYASVEVKETFEKQFGIYDLNEFLGALSLFDDPDISFANDKYAVIGEGRNNIKYFSADETVLTVPSNKIKLPPSDVEFKLTSDQINMIIRTAGVLRAPDVTISGDGKKLSIVVGDKKNSAGNQYQMEIDSTDSTFNAYLKVDNLKVIPGEYKVELAAKKIASFASGSLQYVLSLEADSQFED